jgi:hypothetical protein
MSIMTTMVTKKLEWRRKSARKAVSGKRDGEGGGLGRGLGDGEGVGYVAVRVLTKANQGVSS